MRVLPSGGKLDASATDFSKHGKVVEAPNANRKFSKRVPSASNVSTVFSDTNPSSAERVRGKGRSKSPVYDPFDCSRPDHVNNTPKEGVRVTKMDQMQQSRAREREDHPRFLKKSVPGIRSSSESRPLDVDPIVSVHGMISSGGKAAVVGRQVNQESTPEPVNANSKDYSQMARFRCSPGRTGTIVLQPATLTDTNPSHKPQRFAASPARRHESLVGVLSADPRVVPPPTYKLRTPWHTD
jgi:hypothetical protein